MSRKVEIVIDDIDERTVEKARAWASREGKTFDEVLENFLREMADQHESCGNGNALDNRGQADPRP